MSDMAAVIVPKSDQINADDLIAGPRTIRIRDVQIRPGTEQPVSIFFDGDNNKPWKTCKSMNRVLVAAWGADAKAYVGRSVTIYRDPNVKWGGMAVGGIRISHLSHIDKPLALALTETKGKRGIVTIQPLAADVQPISAAYTIEQAREEIAAADSLDALKAVWTAKVMAPHRQALQGLLDERKAALTFDTGEIIEAETTTDRAALDEALTVIAAASTVADVDERVARMTKALPDHAEELKAAGMARIAELQGAVE